VAGLASAATPVAPATNVTEDGVSYFWSVGGADSGHLVNRGDDTGAASFDFVGCAFAKLRPEKTLGLVRMLGLVNGANKLEATFDEFLSPDGITPGIMTNLTLNASVGQTPALRTRAAAWGTGSLVLDGMPFLDPVGDGSDLTASYAAARDGERDDASGALLQEAQRGDEEMHFHLGTPSGATGQTVSFTIAPPGNTPPNEAYGLRQDFYNAKLGGTAKVHVASSAYATAGMNSFTIAFIAPSGKTLANVTMTPAVLADDNKDVTFPLSEFGLYTVDVRGKVAFATYSLQMNLEPPKHMDLDLWWENVTYGEAATQQWNDCQKQMGYASVPSMVVERDSPPTFLLELVVVAVIGGTAGVLLGVKLVSESVSTLRFKRQGGR
jgi:hypothetical protein